MGISQLKTPALLLAIAGLCGSVLAAPSAAASTKPATGPDHHNATLPAALRPALYRALAEDAASAAYRIGKDGCATLSSSSLKACFDRRGAHFSGSSALALRLVAYGRGGELTAVKSVKPSIEGNRVSYPHGALTEWWRVLPMGFEQGFTLAKRPAGHGKLILSLASGYRRPGESRDPVRKASRPTVGIQNPTSRLSLRSFGMTKKGNGDTLAWGKLRYGKLVVTDAKGKVLPSSLKTQDNRILITVNDARATYPLTVDPLVWIEQKISSNDSTTRYFGRSVALDGNTAIIGAFSAAYVFTRLNGSWTKTQQFTPSYIPDGAFGWSVAIDDNTAVVGAFQDDGIGGTFNAGATYVFKLSDGSWSQSQRLVADDGSSGAEFGKAVAISGHTMLIGAPGIINDGKRVGAAYIFSYSGGAWTQTAKLTSDDSEHMGSSVAISTTTAFVGGIKVSDENIGVGGVYIFTKSGQTWSQTQVLTAYWPSFGRSIATDGTTAIIGDSIDAKVHVYVKSDNTWTQTQVLTASDAKPYERFGSSVSLSGSTVVVGALDNLIPEFNS